MNKIEFREIKPEVRVIGIDDGTFDSTTDERTCLVGVVTRGGKAMDGILVDEVEIDGTDSTSTIVNMINESRHKEQLRVILTSGITFAGFNVLDVNKVFEETGLPVIVVVREEPDLDSVKKAIQNLPNWEKRWEKLNSAGGLVPVSIGGGGERESKIFIQFKGIDEKDAKEVVRMTSTRSSIPEPLRLAHLIATGISRGESVGRV
mgnify:CR=1 FL=1